MTGSSDFSRISETRIMPPTVVLDEVILVESNATPKRTSAARKYRFLKRETREVPSTTGMRVKKEGDDCQLNDATIMEEVRSKTKRRITVSGFENRGPWAA